MAVILWPNFGQKNCMRKIDAFSIREGADDPNHYIAKHCDGIYRFEVKLDLPPVKQERLVCTYLQIRGQIIG